LVNFAEDYDTGEFGIGVVGDYRAEEVDTHRASLNSGGNIFVIFFDEHFGFVGGGLRWSSSPDVKIDR
jgi:hypothetical protein